MQHFRCKEIRINLEGMDTWADGDKLQPNPTLLEVVPKGGFYLVPRP